MPPSFELKLTRLIGSPSDAVASRSVLGATPREWLEWAGAAAPWLSLLFFLALAGLFWRLTVGKRS